MSRTVRKNRIWLIPLCMLIAGAASVCCWQQLQAQAPQGPAPIDPSGGATPFPTDSSATAVAPAPAAVPEITEPTYTFGSRVSGGVTVRNERNWDGTTTQLLRFKYRTMDNKIITVHLPTTYRSEMKTKAGWDSLFRAFAMDQEARLAAIEAKRPPDVSAYMNEFMKEIRGEVPEGTFSAAIGGSPVESARSIARTAIPSMGMQLPPMPVPTGVINP